jgi:nucleotide-binding universal stress UspA family protein
MYRKILVGFDGSNGAKRALHEAAALGKLFEAEVTALWIEHTLPHFPETVDEVDAAKRSINLFFGKLKREIEFIAKETNYPIEIHHLSGHPSATLLEFAEKEEFDLIVLGHSGHSALRGRILGHTADRISENAHCNVLIVRHSIISNRTGH